MNNSSSDSFPCVGGQCSGIALQQYPAVRQKQHAIANILHFVHVVRCPQHAHLARGRVFADLNADLARDGRVQRRRRLVQQQQRRPIQHRLGQAHARLLTRRQHAAFHVAKREQVVLFQQRLNAGGQIFDAVDQSEEAQILNHRQIAGQRRVDGREIGPLQHLRPLRRDVQTFHQDGARSGLQYSQNHVDGGGLAGAIRAQKPDNLVAIHFERNAVHGHRRAVLFTQITN